MHLGIVLVRVMRHGDGGAWRPSYGGTCTKRIPVAAAVRRMHGSNFYVGVGHGLLGIRHAARFCARYLGVTCSEVACARVCLH